MDINTYHPRAAEIHEPYIGPSSNPPVVAHAHAYISQTLSFMLNISSRLPETIIDGTADTNPEIKRPMIGPNIDGTKATTMHDKA